MGTNKLRIVTHLDYTDAMHNKMLDSINKLTF